MVVNSLFGFFYFSGDAFISQALHAACCTFSKGTFGVLISLWQGFFTCVPYSWVSIRRWTLCVARQAGEVLVVLSPAALGISTLRFKYSGNVHLVRAARSDSTGHL